MIHIVVGTRAQLLKMAPVMLELNKRKAAWRWIYTSQHKETMDSLISGFGLRGPDVTLFDWDTEAKTINKMITWLGKSFYHLLWNRKQLLGGCANKQHIVLTHGDTITTWWGALLGKLSGCKVMHVESGLRSFNYFEPFPEEINRIITFALSDFYACPGEWAIKNLKAFKGVKINTYHNTQVETLLYGLAHSSLSHLDTPDCKYAVVSVHRYENIFKLKRLNEIVRLISSMSSKIHIVIVLHPATEIRLREADLLTGIESNPDITTMGRLDHLSFIKLIDKAEFVVTDGGGNQEELFHLGKPCLILRHCTERQDGVGRNAVLSGLDEVVIDDFIEHYEDYKQAKTSIDKLPSTIIVDALIEHGFDQ